MNDTNQTGIATDQWIQAIPDDPYDLCPCGCGMKFRFALKQGIDSHAEEFIRMVTKREGE